MNRKDPLIVGRNSVRDMHHLRLMALLQELVRTWGYTGTARVLEIDPRTVTSSVQSGQLTHRVRESLQRALQHGVGSAADRQRERSDKLEGQLKELKENLRIGLKVLNRLETRLDKTEGQVKEMQGDRRTGLKGLRMSLDGVRKYYGVQRRLIEQRLLVLEADRDGMETGAPTDDGSGGLGARSVAAGTGFPGKLTDPTLAELVDAVERTNGVVEWDMSAPPGGGDEKTDAPSKPGIPGPTRVSRRNLACSQNRATGPPEQGRTSRREGEGPPICGSASPTGLLSNRQPTST